MKRLDDQELSALEYHGSSSGTGTAPVLRDAIVRACAEIKRMRPVYDLVCKLQDSDQCEDHCVGDDCETGAIEDKLFALLSKTRIDEGEQPKMDTARGPQTPVPSTSRHVQNDHDECVSWCPACTENKDRGFNPDGSVRE